MRATLSNKKKARVSKKRAEKESLRSSDVLIVSPARAMSECKTVRS